MNPRNITPFESGQERPQIHRSKERMALVLWWHVQIARLKVAPGVLLDPPPSIGTRLRAIVYLLDLDALSLRPFALSGRKVGLLGKLLRALVRWEDVRMSRRKLRGKGVQVNLGHS
jgi:hypothetical protein